MIDLHIHSIYSDDGELTPTQLVSRCAEEGISIAAITDHNCIRGCREGEMAGGKHSVKVIPGLRLTVYGKKLIFICSDMASTGWERILSGSKKISQVRAVMWQYDFPGWKI